MVVLELVGDSWIMEHTSEFMIPEPLQGEVVQSQVKDRIGFIKVEIERMV